MFTQISRYLRLAAAGVLVIGAWGTAEPAEPVLRMEQLDLPHPDPQTQRQPASRFNARPAWSVDADSGAAGSFPLLPGQVVGFRRSAMSATAQ
ncbi:MAG: hypothetical protein AB7U20_06880, partial [Planctomycetaceae bacterium]